MIHFSLIQNHRTKIANFNVQIKYYSNMKLVKLPKLLLTLTFLCEPVKEFMRWWLGFLKNYASIKIYEKNYPISKTIKMLLKLHVKANFSW